LYPAEDSPGWLPGCNVFAGNDMNDDLKRGARNLIDKIVNLRDSL